MPVLRLGEGEEPSVVDSSYLDEEAGIAQRTIAIRLKEQIDRRTETDCLWLQRRSRGIRLNQLGRERVLPVVVDQRFIFGDLCCENGTTKRGEK